LGTIPKIAENPFDTVSTCYAIAPGDRLDVAAVMVVSSSNMSENSYRQLTL
jgi:hypothetical protein